MSGTFDLNLLPLYRQAGDDQSELPGLYAVAPPRRPARGRDADHLILYLTIVGDLGVEAEQRTRLLERLAQTYYKTSGTVTTAMKGVAEALNAALLERNIQNSNSRRQGIGLLTQAVMRGELLYLGHSGPVHTFLARTQECQHWYDPQAAGRGLGVARLATVRFYQTSLQPNDFIVLAHQPAEAWTREGLKIAPNQGLESLRRRLLSQAGADLSAVLVQVQAGSGKLRLLRLKPAFQDMARPVQLSQEQGSPAKEELAVAPGPKVETPVAVVPEPSSAEVPASPAPRETASPVVLSEGEGEKAPSRPQMPPSADRSAQPAGQVKEPALIAKKKPAPESAVARKLAQGARNGLKELGSILKHAFVWFFGGLFSLFKRLLPDESLMNVSPATMIFFALAIPILISVVGGAVYIRRGQQRQYEAYFQQAQEAVRQAAAKTDPAEQRAAWKVSLEYLDKAEFYQQTDASQALRAQAQDALDQLDAVERLDFQPALLDPFDESVQITRIVAASGDLYLLNSAQGNVYRALQTGRGFELDQTFRCGPQAAAGTVGPLVDITPLPRGFRNGATILGMDLNGALIYCIPGGNPETTVLAPPPVNFGNPKAFAYDAGDLFVIDPPNKSVWVYRNMEIEQPPHQFLGDITSFMVDVIDMAVNADDLYLLHSNGEMTKCTYSWVEGVPTRCEDPFLFTDTRPGRQGGAVIPDAMFDQIAFSPPPDPSLYLLDPQNKAIYHFSLRLTLDRQYRSQQALPEGAATAFAVSPTRLVFLAVGNRVFYAALP